MKAKQSVNKKPKLSPQLEKEIMAKYGHIPTQEEIFTKMKASQERMMEALKGAWESMPNDPEIRSQVIEASTRAAKLREKIYKMMGDTPPKKTPPHTPLKG